MGPNDRNQKKKQPVYVGLRVTEISGVSDKEARVTLISTCKKIKKSGGFHQNTMGILEGT